MYMESVDTGEGQCQQGLLGCPRAEGMSGVKSDQQGACLPSKADYCRIRILTEGLRQRLVVALSSDSQRPAVYPGGIQGILEPHPQNLMSLTCRLYEFWGELFNFSVPHFS